MKSVEMIQIEVYLDIYRYNNVYKSVLKYIHTQNQNKKTSKYTIQGTFVHIEQLQMHGHKVILEGFH